MRKIILLMLLPFQLNGCNALYFYDTEKISLTLEGRPDSSQPIQGSLGLKQRTAILVPPQEKGEEGKDGTDALSLISSFRFTKEEGSLFNLGPVTIQTALVTGDAAILPEIEAQKLSTALSGLDIPSDLELARNIINKLKDRGKLEELQTLLKAIDCKKPSDAQRKHYLDVIPASDFRPELCDALKQRIGD